MTDPDKIYIFCDGTDYLFVDSEDGVAWFKQCDLETNAGLDTVVGAVNFNAPPAVIAASIIEAFNSLHKERDTLLNFNLAYSANRMDNNHAELIQAFISFVAAHPKYSDSTISVKTLVAPIMYKAELTCPMVVYIAFMGWLLHFNADIKAMTSAPATDSDFAEATKLLEDLGVSAEGLHK